MKKCREDLTIDDVIELLGASRDCLKKQVRGLWDECHKDLCVSCELCDKMGPTGEQIMALEFAIKVLKGQKND